MSYEKLEFIGISCDNCKESFLDEHSGFSAWNSESEAYEACTDYGWHEIDRKHYCSECHIINDNDELIILSICPTYLVIADFPENKDFPLGKRINFRPHTGSNEWEHVIEDCQGRRSYLSFWFEKYPHLFKRVYS